MTTDVLWRGPEGAPTLVLAHGAGGAMDSGWMNAFADGIAGHGIRTARFEFAYMAARRSGDRRPPPRAELVLHEYRAAVADIVAVAGAPVVIGGKSMGGRVASMVVDDTDAATGLVCLGYPFHPIGDQAKVRTAHLEHLATPALICQGTRDPFGSRQDVGGYALADGIRVLWLEDGDHDLTPRARLSGFSRSEHLATAIRAVAEFVTARAG
ncbi:dienelactone hydrolase [Galbitalea sp. SE-J8]|uniref:alpha/beta family hydrolase n=1 Tax=Galbitalea sp. SE-J8 TaxID=3054952 RepID=UPI00259C8A88|nr:alpha/beta family hydrolase [Galbitalea sp. SE-J8]MDM4762368.1 dienelactone hydrolase [Galbitalea sp. SE-J8]